MPRDRLHRETDDPLLSAEDFQRVCAVIAAIASFALALIVAFAGRA